MPYLGDCWVGLSWIPLLEGFRGLPAHGMINQASTFYLFYIEKLWIFFFELEKHYTDGTLHTTSWRQLGVHEWPIWVIVGLDYLYTPTGGVLGVARLGMIDLADTFYLFYIEKLWIFFLS